MKTISYSGAANTSLQADLHLPAGDGPFALILGISGGGWVRGHRGVLNAWGRYFAGRGLAFASIDYRRAAAGAPAYPGNAKDVAAGLQYFFDHGLEHGIDPQRIGVLGISAGGHLGALVSLSEDFISPPPKAFAGIYGVYDLLAHWQADRAVNSVAAPDKTECMLGKGPFSDPLLYHMASPLRQVTGRRSMPVFLCWGHLDRDVSPNQSSAFADVLRQAGFPVTALEFPDAAHLWFSEDGPDVPGSHSARLAPALLRFFQRSIMG